MNTKPSIETLVVSRMCHDLISPIGAISNGVELLAELVGQSVELSLIADSVAAAQAKIAYFRLAFGPQDDGVIDGAGLIGTMQNMFTARVRVTQADLPATLPRNQAQLLLLLALCAESSLPVGGELTFGADKSGVMLTAIGRRIAVDGRLWAMVTAAQDAPDVTAPNVHFALAGRAVQAIGAKVSADPSETELRISVQYGQVP